MDTKILDKMVGINGSKALQRIVEKIPALRSVVTPRVLVSWLNTMGGVQYDGEIPGVSGSYISLNKNESGFSGAIGIEDRLYTFEDASITHVAASLGVAMNISATPISTELKKADLNSLGKAIDLLVKSELISSIQSIGFIVDTVGDFNIEKKGSEFLLKHIESNQVFVEGLEEFVLAKSLAVKLTKKIKKKKLGKEQEQFGLAGSTHAEHHEPNKPGAAVKPSRGAGQQNQNKGLATGGQGRPVNLTMSELSKKCNECDEAFFKNEKFVGCMCLKAVAESITLEKKQDHYVMSFDKTLDEEAVSTIIENIKDI